MKVGYVVLYEDGELVISKNHTLLQKKIKKDYNVSKLRKLEPMKLIFMGSF